MKIKVILIIFIVLFLSGCSITGKTIYEEKEGPFKVIKVIDGDTIDLNNSETVRLSGINTPETGECYYQEAKGKLSELVLNKEIFIERDITNKDKYDRLLRYVYINDLFINSILVKEGYAKVYDKYEEDTKYYEKLKQVEEIAIKNNLGVWVCKDQKQGCLYVGSISSKIYHTPDCKWAKRIKPENLICFKTQEEVDEAGYKPCKTCS